MPVYVLRGAYRAADGQIGPPLLEETFTAEDNRKAIKRANERDDSNDDESVNALWLTDSAGNMLWSLRRGT